MEEIIKAEDVQAELSKRLGGRPLVCEVCGGTRWQGGNAISLPVCQGRLGTFTVGGSYLPLMELACTICGNTKFINLVRLGFLPPAQNSVDKLINEALGGA